MLIAPEAIARRIHTVAAELDLLYAGKELTLVMILKGSFILAADLIRALKTPTQVEMISASSYGARGTERGELTITGLERLDIQGRHLLLVDDIFDSGHTLAAVAERLQAGKPASLRTLVLLEKKVSRTVPLRPDHVLFHVENEFVVGYGLDYKEQYRGLPGIGIMA